MKKQKPTDGFDAHCVIIKADGTSVGVNWGSLEDRLPTTGKTKELPDGHYLDENGKLINVYSKIEKPSSG